MPTLHLRITPLVNPERYARLAAELTALAASVLHKKPEVTVLTIDDLPAARFCIGGEAATLAAATLEISITAGTNTATEKQRFVHEAHATLERLLGPLHAASYVTVRELPATDWGYGGLTQVQRRTMAAQV
jgi:4-oxalocrotonate tautomerase